MEILANRLKLCRNLKLKEDKKWTQEYVAKQLDISRVSYTGYENGTKQPPYQVLIGIANLYNVDIDFLLGRYDEPKIGYVSHNNVLNGINELLWKLQKKEQNKVYKFIKLFFYDK